MTTYTFTGSQTTDFPSLVHDGGIGIRLEPGETVDCDVDPVDILDGDEVVVGQTHPGNSWLVPATASVAPKPAPVPPTTATPVATPASVTTSPAAPADPSQPPPAG